MTESLCNGDGDAEDNFLSELNLYFAYESRQNLDLFSVSMALKISYNRQKM